MPNEVVYFIHALDRCIKSSIGINFGWQERTEIFYEPHDGPDQYLDDNDSYYDPDGD